MLPPMHERYRTKNQILETNNMTACGNSQCCSSTGIHEGITFGHGRLDELGYWEFPCRVCAAAYDADHDTRVASLNSQGNTDEQIAQMEWAHTPAWPYAGQDCEELTREFQEQNPGKNEDAFDYFY
jgi:hypothetical protein